MSKISQEVVDSVVRRVGLLDVDGQMELLDELFENHPPLMAAAIALSRAGLPRADFHHVLHVLAVIAECYRVAVENVPLVTEEMLEASARQVGALNRLFEGGRDEDEFGRTVAMVAGGHPERNLFAYVADYFTEHGPARPGATHENALFRVMVIFDAFMRATAQAEEAAK